MTKAIDSKDTNFHKYAALALLPYMLGQEAQTVASKFGLTLKCKQLSITITFFTELLSLIQQLIL
jgi:hypothetical protein